MSSEKRKERRKEKRKEQNSSSTKSQSFRKEQNSSSTKSQSFRKEKNSPSTKPQSPRFDQSPKVLQAQDGIYLIYKPAGIAVHPAGETEKDSNLLTWLQNQEELPEGLAMVHRLDKETSGLILCAADPALRAELSNWFSEGLIKKRYTALVQGTTNRKGILRKPLQDQRRGKPLEAVTRYRKLEGLGGFSLLSIRPQTGRKHQIRKHLKGIGHSLVGDRRYRPQNTRPCPGFPGRLWLHAGQLILPDETLLECPLPSELQQHLDLLRDRKEKQTKQKNKTVRRDSSKIL